MSSCTIIVPARRQHAADIIDTSVLKLRAVLMVLIRLEKEFIPLAIVLEDAIGELDMVRQQLEPPVGQVL